MLAQLMQMPHACTATAIEATIKIAKPTKDMITIAAIAPGETEFDAEDAATVAEVLVLVVVGDCTFEETSKYAEVNLADSKGQKCAHLDYATRR
jgi:hypothetical protein